MEATLLNSDLEIVGYLDIFKSFLWTDKYNEYGEFEIFESPRPGLLYLISQSLYVLIKESEHVMIIESLKIHTDPEEGNELVIRGKSIESILKRRIVWNPTTLSGNLQTEIQRLLNENAISPTDTDRDISLLEFSSTSDTTITSLTVDEKYLGEDLYTVISDLCIRNGIGFKITLTALGKFQFKLYRGVDRSYNQTTNPYVVFSPSFDNLLNSDYLISDEPLKTAALVAGETGVGNIRTFASVEDSSGSIDLNRREMFVDSPGVTRAGYGTETPLTEEEYTALLQEVGYDKLAANRLLQIFDGQVDTIGEYVFGTHFFLGDVVQIANEYGYQATSRVIEMVYYQDASSIDMIPRFIAIE